MAAAKPKPDHLTVIRTDTAVPLDKLSTFDKNPRVGNIDAIAKSLEKIGQYKGIVVNVRDNRILAGNHTYLAARKLGWETIAVNYVDVDDTMAKEIVLADNRTADLGTYDDTILAELLASLPDISVTGYSEVEVQEIINKVQKQITDDIIKVDSYLDLMPTGDGGDFGIDNLQTKDKAKSQDEMTPEEREAALAPTRPDAPKPDIDIADIEDARADLQIFLEAREGVIFPFTNYWGIPELRMDMIAESIPDPIRTWAGHEVTPDDGTTHWIWNDGLASMTGLPRDGRAILSFFTYDDKFDKWWINPAYYTAKAIDFGVRTAFMPDYSIWSDDPRAIHMYNTYRGHWLARWFQESGMKVIPCAFHADLESIKYTVAGIPKGTPTLSLSMQAVDKEGIKEANLGEGVRRIVGLLEPKELLVYAGNPGHEVVRGLDLEGQGIKVIYAMNYAGERRGVAYDKKDGAGAYSKKVKNARKKAITKTGTAEESAPVDDDADYEEDVVLGDDEAL